MLVYTNMHMHMHTVSSTYSTAQTQPLCKKGCYTRLYNIVMQVVIQYLLYTLRIIVYNCV